MGETSRHLKTRIAEHRGVSARTGRQMCNVRSNIFQHRVDTGHTVTPDAFEVLHSGSENLKLTESILIHSLKPSLNTNLYSTPLNVLLYSCSLCQVSSSATHSPGTEYNLFLVGLGWLLRPMCFATVRACILGINVGR